MEKGAVGRIAYPAQGSTSPGQRVGVTARVLRVLGSVALHASTSLLALLFVLPLVFMVSTSLKDDPQVFHLPLIWIPDPVRWANYPEALGLEPFGQFIVNTIVRFSVPSLVGVCLSNPIVAYGFSRLRWRGRDAFFFLCLSTMMVPYQVVMVPLYVTFRALGWLDTYLPLVVPAFFGYAFPIFLLRQFFMTIPEELSEAARIDGCSELGILVRVILPLAKPALAVVALFQFMATWNDYLGPLIYLTHEANFPVALGLQLLSASGPSYLQLQWPHLMAATAVVTSPVIILYFVTQRTFVEGITVTGIKA